MNPDLIFIKLGGSLLTYKDQPETARPEMIEASLMELVQLRSSHPQLSVLLGHGSGSFGHSTAKRFGTMNGVSSAADWLGFAEVARSAAALNQLVTSTGMRLGLPLESIRPSSHVVTSNRKITAWDVSPIQDALDQGKVPLIFGDVAIDSGLGGTILSTEDLFVYLTSVFKPSKTLIAGVESGVYQDFPANTRVLPFISRDDPLGHIHLQGAITPDVTGGMLAKVRLLQQACQLNPGMKAVIYDGAVIGNLTKLIEGQSVGTTIQ